MMEEVPPIGRINIGQCDLNVTAEHATIHCCLYLVVGTAVTELHQFSCQLFILRQNKQMVTRSGLGSQLWS